MTLMARALKWAALQNADSPHDTTSGACCSLTPPRSASFSAMQARESKGAISAQHLAGGGSILDVPRVCPTDYTSASHQFDKPETRRRSSTQQIVGLRTNYHKITKYHKITT